VPAFGKSLRAACDEAPACVVTFTLSRRLPTRSAPPRNMVPGPISAQPRSRRPIVVVQWLFIALDWRGAGNRKSVEPAGIPICEAEAVSAVPRSRQRP
jgi:hypothetical protein